MLSEMFIFRTSAFHPLTVKFTEGLHLQHKDKQMYGLGNAKMYIRVRISLCMCGMQCVAGEAIRTKL